LLAAQVIPSDAELDIQDAQIGRALRAFLARGVEEGWLEAPFDAAGASAEQCVAALGALLGARDAAERGLAPTEAMLLPIPERFVHWGEARAEWRRSIGFMYGRYERAALPWLTPTR